MQRRRFLRRVGAAGGVATTTALAGCSAVGGEPDHDVGMVAAGYRPRKITVSVGETVVWENTSARAHTVTATRDGIPSAAEFFASGGFEDFESAEAAWNADFGGILESGDRFEHTFSVPGAYEYVCIPHQKGGMYGTVVVEE